MIKIEGQSGSITITRFKVSFGYHNIVAVHGQKSVWDYDISAHHKFFRELICVPIPDGL